MLRIEHLTMTHREDLRTLLEDFSLTLHAGDRAVLVGEEGNGKSTLLKWIFDPALVEDYIDWEGRRVCRARLGYLPQELPAEERETPVRDYLAARDPEGGAHRRLYRSLGLPEAVWDLARPMGSLSGGERVKLQMAALLSAEPELLLLDEPSNDLDIATLEWMERRIADHDGAVLFISHDETLIRRTANRVILLEQLRHKQRSRWTVANLDFDSFMAQRREGFEKQAQLARSERRAEREAKERFQRIQQRVEHEQNVISRADPSGGRLLKKKMASVKALERRYEREHAAQTPPPEFETAIDIRFDRAGTIPAGKTVLDLRLPELRTPDGRLLARDLALLVRGPERLGIIGRNGAGKTTLLRQMQAALADRRDLRVMALPQDYRELLDGETTPLDLLAPSGSREARTLARTRLGSLRYTAREMERPVSGLSGGQKAKLLLLRLTLGDADVLLLDEPTRNLSPLSGPEVRALFRSFPGAILSVSHDRSYLSEVCTRVVELTPAGLVEVKFPAP